MNTTVSDADLLGRARVDPSAMGEVYERHAVRVHRYLSRRAGAQLADDLLGEVFVVALRQRTRVVAHPSSSALPWLYGIAANLLRAAWRRTDRPLGAPDIDVVDWDAVDARLDAQADRERLRTVLAGLTPGEREVLLLVAWEGLSVTEAAQAAGLTAVAARSRLHRARARAQAALTAEPLNLRRTTT